MVNSDGQLFTIEGIAAALIMLMTVYIVVNTTSVYTAGDTHINDMQLEVIGSDALKMMNTPNDSITKSPLETLVENNDGAAFYTNFSYTLNNRTGTHSDNIQFMANVSYVRSDQSINSSPLNSSRPLYGGEHAVHISQWIIVYKPVTAGTSYIFPDPYEGSPGTGAGNHTALVEVMLWRD
jgi:hypothetical protein